MTITVTIEELRAYETAMNNWHGKRGQEIERLLRQHPSTRDCAITEWQAANPKPALIPAV